MSEVLRRVRRWWRLLPERLCVWSGGHYWAGTPEDLPYWMSRCSNCGKRR